MHNAPFLRDGPDADPVRQQQIANLEDRLARTAAASEQTMLLGQLGDALRAVGAYEEAVAHLEKALMLARQQRDARRVVANLIRLATTRQYRGEHAVAVALFHDAIDGARNPDCQDYADFAWQHLGKCLVEQGQLTEALRCFEHARELRIAKGDAALLASTEAALAAARALA